MKIKWEETGDNLFPATAHFSQISRSYFRVPFTYASSLQSQSLMMKTGEKVNFLFTNAD